MQIKTLAQLITDCKFTYVNKNIEKLFSTESIRGKIEIRNFGKTMTSEEVIAELAKDGCVPANATELFYYLSTHDVWKKKWLVGLGSVVSFDGCRRAPYASWDDAGREAGLDRFGYVWNDSLWFAYVHESSDTQKLNPSDIGLVERIKALEDFAEKVKKVLVM